MKSKVRLSLSATLLAGATLVAAACGGGATAPTATTAPARTPATTALAATATPVPVAMPKPGGVLKVGSPWNPGMLDAHASTGGHEIPYIRAMYDNLVDRDNSMTLRPGTSLAESWAIVDPVTIDFQIRKGVRNHDGTPVNADLVKWNMERVLDPETRAAEGGFVRPVVKSIEVIDEFKVRFNLKQPSASLLPLLGDRVGTIMSKAAVEKYGKDIRRNPVATGPFKFARWEPDAKIVVERNADYWQKGKPLLDGIEWRILLDRTVLLATLEAGEVDAIMDLEPKDVARVMASPRLKAQRFVGTSVQYMYGNYKLPPWDNVNFRRAFAYAIDREAILQGLYFGEGKVAVGPVLPAFGWAYNDKLLTPKRDVAKAKEFLKASGLGERVEFTLGTYTDPFRIRLAESMQADLAEVGMIANIRTWEIAAWVEAFQQEKIAVMVAGIVLRGDPDAAMGTVFHSTGFYNPAGKRLIAAGDPTQKKLDQLIEEARATYDLAERKKKYDESQQLILDNAYGVFTLYANMTDAVQRYVEGWDLGPESNHRWAGVWLNR